MARKARNNDNGAGTYQKSINLYGFIRLILGPDMSDRQIAQRWHINEKNFHEFKTGKYPVPRLEKLEELATMLDINKHLVFQVASGTQAQKVFNLLSKNDLRGQIRLLSNQLDESHKALAKSEYRYRQLFENANDAIFIADTKTGILLDCNKKAEELVGRTRNEIRGLHQSHLHPRTKKTYYRKHFKTHVRNGQGRDLQIQEVIRKDGTVIPVYISARVMEIDGRKIIAGIFREFKFFNDGPSNGTKVQQRSEQRYRKLFENVSDAIFVADIKTGVILDCNKEASRLTGRSKKELIGTPTMKLHPPDKIKKYKKQFKEAVRHGHMGTPEAQSIEIIKKGGDRVPVHINTRVIDLNGLNVLVGVFRKIDYRHQDAIFPNGSFLGTAGKQKINRR